MEIANTSLVRLLVLGSVTYSHWLFRGTDFLFQILPFSVSEFNKFRFFPFSSLYSTDVFSITHTYTHTFSLSLTLSLSLSQTAGLKNEIKQMCCQTNNVKRFILFYIFSLYVYYDISNEY